MNNDFATEIHDEEIFLLYKGQQAGVLFPQPGFTPWHVNAAVAALNAYFPTEPGTRELCEAPTATPTQDAAGYAAPAAQGETPDTLYAAALDTLKDMSAQVAQLTGAQDRMDAEIAMLTADLFRATSERDQARQDLEERCAENDRERAAHLQAYQAVTRERDEVRQWLAERPSTELYQRAVTRNEVLCAKLTAATEEAERLRERTEKLRNQRDLAEAEADTLRQQLATSQDWGEKAREAIGLALDQIDDQRNASESAGRCIDRLTALLSSYPAQGMEGRG